GDVSGLAAPAPHGRQRVVVVAARPGRAAAGENGEVGGVFQGAGAGAAEGSDRHHDQIGPDAAQVVVVEAQFLQTARSLSLDEDVGAGHQVTEAPDAVVGPEVDGDAPFAGVVVPEVQALPGVG